MNSPNRETNAVNESAENESAKRATIKGEALQNARKRSKLLVVNGQTPSMSRYGRIIKPKSPENAADGSPKTTRVPKTSMQINSSNSNNESLEENNISNDTSKDIVNDSSVAESVVNEESLPVTEETLAECSWIVGQLAWARVGNYPFWPCVVSIDPDSMTHYKKKNNGRYQSIQVHVLYFGDRGRHGWVSASCMIPFTSLSNFKKLAETAAADGKKKDPKYAAAFVVKGKIKVKWDNAVSEAIQVRPLSIEARAEMFKPVIKNSKSKPTKTAEDNDKSDRKKQTNDEIAKAEKKKYQNYEKDKAEKRKLSNDINEPEPKRAKHQTGNNAEKSDVTKIKSHRSVENGRNFINVDTETPPASPSSNDGARTSQRNYIRNDIDRDGVFEAYYERNRDMLEDEYPDATEDDIKRYLKKTWNDMNSSYRKKYRPYITPESSIKSKESSSDQEDDTSAEIESTKENKKNKIREKEETPTSETRKSRPYNLFKGMKQEKVCQICEKTGKLTRCRGPCFSYFHLECVKPGESSAEESLDEKSLDAKALDDVKDTKKSMTDEDEGNGKSEDFEDESFKCIDCLSGVAPACFICNERDGDRIRCSAMACGKHYHSVCLKSWPQAHWQGGRLTCPYHMCHTCSSDNPQDSHFRTTSDKLARCVRCPSSYHPSPACLPAGSAILTGSQIICPKHYKAPHPPLNATWCFLCTKGGSLICCDTCPTSFHLECLGINAPDGAFICEDCETGRLPLYGEVVWVKLGHYRWWPSRICFPNEIPEKVAAIPHSPGKFCVMFLGSNNYYWVHRGRAFLYQEGDANIKIPSTNKKSIRDDVFRRAVEEASRIHQELKNERATAKDHGPRGLKPPPYVKLKVNKPVGNVKPAEVESMVACDCSEEWDNPCAPETDCLNRILLVECSPDICPAGTKCKNQSFLRREYPSMEAFHTAERGWGLRSLEPIRSGQFVIEYVGEVIDEAEYRRRLHRKKELKNENYYFLTIDNNRTIDAEPKGNLSRFMNHSCMPNCETQKWTVNGDTRIGLFALKDIEPGEELTFNYNLASDGETRKPCLCGAPNCSGFIGLKVQKQQQLSAIQEKKIEKAEKVKRQRRFRKVKCWSCGKNISKDDVHSYIVCDQKTCNKKYHVTCLRADQSDARFSCPWHHCLDCGKRTSAHCSLCSAAFCQVHLEGNLFENGEKYVCKVHENADVQKSIIDEEKDYSDNEMETDKDYSSTTSTSPTPVEKMTPRESSPRVSIVEVVTSSEESEESQKEDEEMDPDPSIVLSENKRFAAWRRKTFHRLSLRLQEEEEQANRLNNLTSSQLEAIIGGRLFR